MKKTLLAALVLLSSGCYSVRRASCYVTTPGPSYGARVRFCKALWNLDEALTKYSKSAR